MKIDFLGTGNGNPNPNHGHSGILIEIEDRYYLFDLGDGIATKIWLDKTKDWSKFYGLFISHLHPDHLGGFFTFIQLLHQIAKLHDDWALNNERALGIHLPSARARVLIEELMDMMHDTCYNKKYFDSEKSGVIYSDEKITVEVLTNKHRPFSRSFIIQAENKKIIFSGDLREPDEIKSVSDNSDLVIIEGAHFPIEKIRDMLSDINVKKLIVTHLLDQRIADKAAVMDILQPLISKMAVSLAYDGYVVEL
ncbi:MAG: hypothetical protein L3J71_08605 [Victivallaceae bacterium]|nr:hypothetical protein [Victivallaceae bacterium]